MSWAYDCLRRQSHRDVHAVCAVADHHCHRYFPRSCLGSLPSTSYPKAPDQPEQEDCCCFDPQLSGHVRLLVFLEFGRLALTHCLFLCSLIPVSAVHLHYMDRQINSSDPSLEGTIATVVAEIHVALSVMVLITPLMKPFIAAYVDENGLAYTDEASNSRSPHSSRSQTVKGLFKPRDPYASTEEEPLSHQQTLAAETRIMKSVQISVDRHALELSERGKRIR